MTVTAPARSRRLWGLPPTLRVGVALAAMVTIVLVGLAGLFASPASAQTLTRPGNAVGASTAAGGQVVGAHQPVLAGQRRTRAPNYDRMASGSCVAAETGAASDASGEAASALRTGYHATHPEFADSIRAEGFRLSEGGRLGGGGVYVSDTPGTAAAEFAAHSPGVAPEILRVQYDPGQEFMFDQPPGAPYFKGVMPPEWADTLTAPSVQNTGGWNSLVRNGSQVVLP